MQETKNKKTVEKKLTESEKMFMEYNYGDVHVVSSVIREHLCKAIEEAKEKIGHDVDVLDFVRASGYAVYNLFDDSLSKDDKIEEEDTMYTLKAVNKFTEEYLRQAYTDDKKVSIGHIISLPFMLLDSCAYKVFSYTKQLELEKAKNEKK